MKCDLKILIDTSIIYSDRFLVDKEFIELINGKNEYPELKLSWFIPEVVISERRYQLFTQVEDLFHSVKRLYCLINQPPPEKRDGIKEKIDEQIKNLISKYSISIHHLNTKNIDWERVIHNSVERLPPFEAGKKEKGFRDALVLENYFQLLTEFRDEPNRCLVILATADKLQIESVEDRFAKLKNFHSPLNISELRELLRTLSSQVSEADMIKTRDLASKYFYLPDSPSCFFNTAQIREKIISQFHDKFEELPFGAEGRTNGNWQISKPEFVDKTENRWTWLNKISVNISTFKTVNLPVYKIPPQYFSGSTDSFIQSPPTFNSSTGSIVVENTKSAYGGSIPNDFPLVSGTFYPPSSIEPTKVQVGLGEMEFELKWSFEIDKEHAIVKPRIDDIRLSKYFWNPNPE